MNIVAFRPEHLHNLALQESQQKFGDVFQRAGYAQALIDGGPAFTALVDGHVIGCSGCVELWENRAMAWALVSKDAGRHMMAVHRAVHGFLMAAKWKRIEASVDAGFEPGMRWMRMLGFTNETPNAPMKAYRPDGGDAYLFSRVR